MKTPPDPVTLLGRLGAWDLVAALEDLAPGLYRARFELRGQRGTRLLVSSCLYQGCSKRGNAAFPDLESALRARGDQLLQSLPEAGNRGKPPKKPYLVR